MRKIKIHQGNFENEIKNAQTREEAIQTFGTSVESGTASVGYMNGDDVWVSTGTVRLWHPAVKGSIDTTRYVIAK